MTVRIGISGSRDLAGVEDAYWVWSALYDAVAEFGDDIVVIQGEAPGADQMAKSWAIWSGHDHEDYPANWTLYNKAAGPIRNRQMLASGLDRLYAFPTPDSVGTLDMINICDKAGVEVITKKMHVPEVDASEPNVLPWVQTTIEECDER